MYFSCTCFCFLIWAFCVRIKYAPVTICVHVYVCVCVCVCRVDFRDTHESPQINGESIQSGDIPCSKIISQFFPPKQAHFFYSVLHLCVCLQTTLHVWLHWFWGQDMNTHQTCVVKFMSPLSLRSVQFPEFTPYMYMCVCVCVCVCVSVSVCRREGRRKRGGDDRAREDGGRRGREEG